MFVCLQSLGTKGTLHPLPTLLNKEPVPQVIETGCKPVLFLVGIGFQLLRLLIVTEHKGIKVRILVFLVTIVMIRFRIAMEH